MRPQEARPVRIGVQLAPQHADYPDVRRAAREAEQLGADVIFNWDHFYPLGKDRTGKHFECWTMLGSWAETTTRAEIGALVTCNSYRNPDLLADMARTVDHISGGRLVLGIGAGFRQAEHMEFGYEFGTAAERVDALAKALLRIEERWRRSQPPPTRKIPMLIAAGGERRSLKLVAKHADIWHTFAEGTDLDRKTQVLGTYCAELGRDPSEIERSVHVGGRGPELVGAALRAQGVSLVTVSSSGPRYDLSVVQDWLRWRDEQNAVGRVRLDGSS